MEQRLFIFNPTSEMAIANGEVAWQPNRFLQQFEKDLELLPYIFAENGDYIIVNELPQNDFLKQLKAIKNITPIFIEKSSLKSSIGLENINNISLQPWGWSPATHHTLRLLKPQTSEEFQNSPNYKWSSTHKDIVSRQFSTKLLKSIVSNNPDDPFLPENLHPVIIYKPEQVEFYIKKWKQIVLKSPFSSSGRGVQMLRYADLNVSNKQWISGIIRQQGFIMLEPLLNKLQDFSLQFHISNKHIKFLGIGKFETGSNGQYIANIINPDTTFIEQILPIEILVQKVTNVLQQENIQSKYKGYAGFDLMTIKHEDQTLIHPCVEVNWRYNMGLLAVQIQKLIHPEASGKFSIHFDPKKSFELFVSEMSQSHPITHKNNLLYKGFFPLSDPEKTVSGAYFILE